MLKIELEEAVAESEAMSPSIEYEDVVVDSQIVYEEMGRLLRVEVRLAQNMIREIFMPLVDQAKAVEREARTSRQMIEGVMKEQVDPWLQIEQGLKRKMEKFSEDRERALAAVAARSGSSVDVAQLDTGPSPTGSPVRKKWKGEVVNVEKINYEYLKPDTAAINRVVTSMGPDAVKVVGEGLRVVRKHQVAISNEP